MKSRPKSVDEAGCNDMQVIYLRVGGPGMNVLHFVLRDVSGDVASATRQVAASTAGVG
jgi:hypothetical protein